MPSFGGGFGNTQQQAPATSTPSFGGGFGTSAATINTSQAPTTTFSGFGNNAQQQQAKPAAAGGFSGFGMATQKIKHNDCIGTLSLKVG
jgi:hypothetical protein